MRRSPHLAPFLAVVLALVATGIAAAAAADAPATKSQPGATTQAATSTGKPVVAVFRLDGPMTEAPSQDLALFGPPAGSLKQFVDRMNKAADDANVKAVVITADAVMLGPAQIEEVRQAMARVRGKGKDVFVHCDSTFTLDYVLFSNASRLSVVPTGMVWVTGIYGESLHLRALLDKIHVAPDMMTCGEYKSAAEIFTRTGPSPQADEMMNWLFDGLYGSFVRQIAAGRNVPEEKVKQWIDEGPYSAETAKAAGLIDAVEQRQQFEAMLAERFGKDVVFEKKYGQEAGPQLDLSSPFGLMKLWAEILAGPQKRQATKDTVAVVYVNGIIVPGNSQPSLFGTGGVAASSDIRRALDRARNDPKVKAVVLRVDSQGGSAVASEIILDATRRVKAGKPLVVSMGNVAGSGGYYVALGTDTIFADETTLTGSIGVAAGKFVTTGMWDTVGVTFKPYARGKNSGILASDHPFTDAERAKVRAYMDEVYATFKKHVTDARGDKLKKPIDDLAGGRVYTGRQALELGLVDKIGTLHDAIAHAAGEAKLTDYDVRVVPEPKNLIEMIIEDASGAKDEDPAHVTLADLRGQASLVQLALPHLRHLDPTRAKLVMTALERLQLLGVEGVSLTMPEIAVK